MSEPVSASGTVIRRQIKLPFTKAVEISLKSIRIRFWRSMITAAGILLGIAFFASVRMSAVFSHAQQTRVEEKRATLARGGKLSAEDVILINSASANAKEEAAAGTRLQWLSIMALLVCTVGITNSMLMSVTERFKEIGTMKCLGALDGFIVKLFFIESCFLGFIASVLGFVVGWLVISLIRLAMDGIEVFGPYFWMQSLRLCGQSAAIGTVLTFLATIFPAYRAAKMPPVAALRAEV